MVDDTRHDADNDNETPGWLVHAAEAAYSLRNRDAGLDPIALAEGSVMGFGVAQARVILDDSRLLQDLLAHWKVQGEPSSIIRRIADTSDTRGRLHRQLLDARSAVDTAASGRVFSMFARRRSTLSYSRPEIALAASTDSEVPGRTRELDYPDVNATVTLFLTADNHTVFEVTATPGDVDSEVAWIRFFDGDRGADLLILLSDGASDQRSGEIVVPGNHLNADYSTFSIIDATAVPVQLASDVTTAIRLSSTSARNAWRGVARSLPADHHVRQAIVAGLR